MMNRYTIFIIAVLLQIVCTNCRGQKKELRNEELSKVQILDRPKNPKNAINDFASIFTKEENYALEMKMRRYNDSTTNEIVCITLNDIDTAFNIADYGLAYGKGWGIGSANKNNGIILLLSKKPRQMRIEVGKGLEDVLPNDTCAKILNKTMVPLLKEQKIYEAFDKATDEIIFYINDKFKPTRFSLN